jgi:hypothetical protein
MQLPWIGYRIFKWLLLLTAFVMFLIFLYAFFTFPDRAAIVNGSWSTDTPFKTKLDAASAAQADWLASVKDLAQLFVITPLFPLMGAVIGYVFGVSRQPSEDSKTKTQAQAVPDVNTSSGTP